MTVWNQFDNFMPDFDSIIKEALQPFEKEIVRLIESQQHTGKDGYGVDFNEGKSFYGARMGAYSIKWGKPRKRRGLQTGAKDFHYTGAYHKSLETVFYKDRADIYSTSPISGELEDLYGKAILKLAPENIAKLLNSGAREAILRKFRQKVIRSA